ncbi:two-component regulator propeller domain-containing protein [Dysgonomonas sp. 511]|uniref:hybrid sensor histidine kinase/response regulator transcription factor n=1 Tax=Dysgonomonas sp. 511 TaxID=2302930 RepID=UPI0013D18C9B|nr:two-component regulator propeller domain-containing protein [Dysgonomonas sp. 511]NDV77571.1 response regulator [Dysgonomonas sp. 511]
MKNNLIILLGILAGLLSNSTTFSQNNPVASQYIFSAISIDQGLPSNFIDDIFKDSHGFIWVSTQGGGLSRYDGYGFVTFNVNSVPVSLKSNFIRKSIEDDYNRLWVVSNNGIDIISLETLKESGLSHVNDLAEVLSNPSINTVFKDSKGAVWLLSNDRIFKIDFDNNGEVRNISQTAKDNASHHFFTTLCEINDEIWAGNNGSIYKIIPTRNNSLLPQLIPEIPKLGPGLFISTILKKENYIWFGTENALFRYDLSDKSIKHYTHNPADDCSISQHMVTDLCFTGEGTLIAGTLKGLNVYNPSNDNFERLSHHNNEQTLNNDFINCILPDGNNLWIGTEAGGLNRMTKRRLAVRNYTHIPLDKNSLSANPVNAIYEDHNGNLWVGTVEGGLNLRNKGHEQFIHYTTSGNFLSHNSVSTLEEDRYGNLWIGTWGGGISIFDIKKSPVIAPRHLTNPGLDYIGILKYDPVNDGIWICTNRNILYYDIKTGNLRTPLPNEITQNIMGTLGCIIDDRNQLWIGCSAGLILVDIKSFDHTNYTCPARFLELDNEEINKWFLKNITSIYQAEDKDIWIGSNGYGMCKLALNGDKYTSEIYTTSQGIANNTIFGILEDEQGLIWVSTGRGISCYNPMTRRFSNYTKNDGLANDQFYWNAFYKSPSSKNMYFGSMGGLIELKGSHQYTSSNQQKVVFTKLQILNSTIWYDGNNYIDKDISYTNRIELHESDKSFSIEFSALDYDNPSTVIYSYRLLGFDDNWVETDANRRFISYTNLRPDTYKLQVRCMSRSYDWSNDIAEIEITVHPFFYKTSWFIGLVILLLVILAVQFYKWRVNSLKNQREILHRKVEERTRELENQKKLLEEQAIELKLQNNVLFTQNEKISAQRRQLISMSKKVQEAMTDRIAFFTNITHEFRTPITLIIGPIERALKLSTNPKVIEQLQYVARNSKHLLSLVNQLMDFRKVESDNMKINLTTGNILASIDEILIPFESFAQERGIIIKTVYRVASPYILFDEEAVRKLITNLLSNAIKFTPDNGTVRLYVGSVTDDKTNEEKLYICVQDSGIGIKDEDLNRIFNRFYQSKDHDKYPVYGQSGTGIGLYLCKNIVTLLGGKIYAKNNHNQGASFRLLIPIKREDIANYFALNKVETDPTEEPEQEEDIQSPLTNKQDTTILVVEDNMDMRKYITSILSDYYHVAEAENGAEALDVLKSNSIDFIISDLMMPVMDGLELSQKVKADLSISHIPFLMLTAKTSLETQISSYKIGVDEFLAKPFDEELLLTRVKNMLDTRKRYQRKFSMNMNIGDLNIAEESNDERFLKKALEIVKENYKNTEYEVNDFINAMNVSKSLLNKKMQTLTGQSAGNFIRNYRLNIAREMILKSKGNMNISEIAYEVGFNDPKYFTRCFTKHFGVPPSNLNKK